MTPVEVHRGTGAVVLGLPHTGTHVPPDIWAGLNDTGRALADTDWHIHRLYDGLLADATTVRATFHRYVIDANRGPDDASLYPGQNTTGLCPTTDFDCKPIHLLKTEPDKGEIAHRRAAFHAPYHAALQGEMDRVRGLHGYVILWDCHSIRSHIPFLFDGILPDLNIGTNSGKSASPELVDAVMQQAGKSVYSHVLNGRFKGGWTTRHYGDPAKGIHAIQLELAQSTHLASEHAPFDYDTARADRLRDTLSAMLTAVQTTARELYE